MVVGAQAAPAAAAVLPPRRKISEITDLSRPEVRIPSRAEDEEPVTILIQAAIAALLLLGSVLIFKEVLELDGPRPRVVPAARPAIRERRRPQALRKAA